MGCEPVEARAEVIFKSRPLTGIMAEPYFDLATPRHFWCRRRFEVLQMLAGDRLRAARKAAEIGCGNGVLQRQIEDAYELAPAGFDLHEAALRKSMTRRGAVYCYDIHERAPEFHKAFDLLLLFDVLEHIEDQDRFLDAARFHLAEGGAILLNVPALQWLYSAYDRVQGHYRRYSLADVEDVARRNGFDARKSTYWGGPLVAVAALRKAALMLRSAGQDDYARGFDPGSEWMNKLLYRYSTLEALPQRAGGTSVMAVLEMRS